MTTRTQVGCLGDEETGHGLDPVMLQPAGNVNAQSCCRFLEHILLAFGLEAASENATGWTAEH